MLLQLLLQELRIINNVNKNNEISISCDWCKLPSTALEIIYSYLNKKDQVNMSLVCKSWSHEYGSPSLWKTFKFNLFGKKAELCVFPEIKFARRFGCMFKNLVIKGSVKKKQLNFRSKEAVNKAYLQMQLFLKVVTLSKCQLLSIKFQNICENPIWFNETEYSNLYQSVLNFMSTQKHLQTVVFHKCSFKIEDAVNILRVVCENNANTLVHLNLERFFTENRDNAERSSDMTLQFKVLTQSLLELKSLKTDYSQNFENILCSFSGRINQKKKKLLLLELNCNGSKRAPGNGIPPAVWQHLRKTCPSLEVAITLTYTYRIRNLFRFYFVNYIPLVSLKILLRAAPISEEVVLGDLFQQLYSCRATEHLKVLFIAWMPTVDNISTDLIPFLQACLKLETFEMWLRYPASGVRELFESLLQSRPVLLQLVKISIIEVTDEANRCSLMLLADYYSHIFKRIGLNVILLTHSS